MSTELYLGLSDYFIFTTALWSDRIPFPYEETEARIQQAAGLETMLGSLEMWG